jgi:predicted DNA-binding transcriptional regulator YafY
VGKISNAILMLEYLNTGNKYSVKALSDKLGITERMIRYYKEELQNAGIYIDSFMGPNGGYFLTKIGHSYKQFTKYDIKLLESAIYVLE